MGQTLRRSVYGEKVSTYKNDKDDYEINVRFNEDLKNDNSASFNQPVTFRDQASGTLQQVLYYFEAGLVSKNMALQICDDIDKVIKHTEEQTIQQSLKEAKNKIEAAHNKGLKRIEELNTELNILKNQTDIIIIETAQNKAADILGQGDKESVKIIESAKNSILSKSVTMLVVYFNFISKS